MSAEGVLRVLISAITGTLRPGPGLGPVRAPIWQAFQGGDWEAGMGAGSSSSSDTCQRWPLNAPAGGLCLLR